MKTVTLFIASCITALSLNAQTKMGDSPTSIGSGSLLELESSSKGLVLPRMNTTSQNSIPSPLAGMVIYNTDSGCVSQYSGSAWKSLCSSSRTTVGVFSDTTTANAADPVQIFNGNLIYDLSCGCDKVYYNGAWRTTGDFALARVFTDTSVANSFAPNTKLNGNIIIDQSTVGEKVYYSGKWVTPTASPLNYIFNDTTAANSFTPSIDNEGQQFFDKSCSCLKVRYNGSWTFADGVVSTPVGFSAVLTTTNPSLTIGTGTTNTEINFGATDFNDGNAYTASTTDSKFTAPVTGVYHFDISVLTSIGAGLLGKLSINVVVDGTTVYTQTLADLGVAGLVAFSSQGGANFGKDLKLNAGQVLRLYLGNTGLSVGVNLITSSTFFDGHLVR